MLKNLLVKGIIISLLLTAIHSFANAQTLTNLAIGKNITVSSYDSSLNHSTDIIDGDLTSSWKSLVSADGDSSWIEIDIGQPEDFTEQFYYIDRINIHWGDNYAVKYSIWVKNPNHHWAQIYDTTTGDGGLDSFNYSELTVSRIKIVLTESSHTTGYEINEIELIGDRFDMSKYHIGKTIVASTEISPEYSALNAADGKNETKWISGLVDPDNPGLEYMYHDLGRLSDIRCMSVFWERGYQAQELEFYTSDDGVNWTSRGKQNGTPGGESGNFIYYEDPLICRYVGVIFLKPTNQVYSVIEFEIEGIPHISDVISTPQPTPTPVPGHVNIGLGKVTCAFSSQPEFPDDNLSDGDYNTEWRSAKNGYDDNLEFNLGYTAEISQLKIHWGDTGYPTEEISIYSSIDKKKWKHCYLEFNKDSSAPTIINFRPYLKARNFQIVIATSANDLFFTVKEVEIFGNPNMAYDAPVTTHSIHSSDFDPKYMTDNDPQTSWKSHPSFDESYIYFALTPLEHDYLSHVSKIILNWDTTGYAKKYSIFMSSDLITWEPVISNYELSQGGITEHLLDINCRYIAVYCHEKDPNSDTYVINEVGLYN